MTRDQILQDLKDIMATVKPKLDTSAVTEDSSLVRDLGVDSLSMLLISLAIEMKYGFQFATQEPFQTVSEVIDYIEKAVN